MSRRLFSFRLLLLSFKKSQLIAPYPSGRGRRPTQRPAGFLDAANLSSADSPFFLRDAPLNALDAVAFHYSIYRSLTRFLGMDGNLNVAYDVDVNFVTAWNQIFVDNDFLNTAGTLDPRHMYGTSNFDVFRWPSLQNGTQRSALGTFITSLVMPGIPLVSQFPSVIFLSLLSDLLQAVLWGGAKLLSL